MILLARQSNKSHHDFSPESILFPWRIVKEVSVSRCLVQAGPGKKEFHSIAVNGASARN